MVSLEKVAVHRKIDDCNNKKNYLKAEDPLEKGMTAHSSILAWRIPQTEEPGGLQSIASQSDMTEVT